MVTAIWKHAMFSGKFWLMNRVDCFLLYWIKNNPLALLWFKLISEWNENGKNE